MQIILYIGVIDTKSLDYGLATSYSGYRRCSRKK